MIEFNVENLMQRFKRAQFVLDTQIMIDMEPKMPRQTGQFIQLTKARSASYAGKGIVYAGTGPYGHFLHTGKVMVDPVTLSPFARRGVTKIYTDRDLKLWYPGAEAHWFDATKRERMQDWVQLVARTIAGGSK